MFKFAIIRLGKDSVEDIRRIDSYTKSPENPISMAISCKQVPTDIDHGDYVFLCLGSDNSKGLQTEWTQGLRAFGVVESKSGGPNYNDTWVVKISVEVVFPKSMKPQDFLARAATAYYWCCNVPVVGVSTYSNQTVQLIKNNDKNQDIRALLYSIESVTPGVKTQICDRHPELSPLYNYTPPAPRSTGAHLSLPENSPSNPSLQKSASLPADWILALAARGFLIVSGPSGTGKTRNGRDIARSLDYSLGPEYSLTTEACKPSTNLAFVTVGADWTDATPILGFKNMFGPERRVSSPTGEETTTNDCWTPPSVLRLLLRAVSYPEQPHFVIFDEMNLSHVERYLGNFLSVLEANRGLDEENKLTIISADEVRLIFETLDHTGEHPLEKDACLGLLSTNKGLSIPDNVFFIGTINVDETTYMFSPKVLDRCHVLEMDIPDPRKYLSNENINSSEPISADEAISILRLSSERRRNGFWERIHPMDVLHDISLLNDFKDEYLQIRLSIETLLIGMQKLLSPVGFGFAFRTMNEICTYISTYIENGNTHLFETTSHKGWQVAIDKSVYQKILPKLHGSRRQLGESLHAVKNFLNGIDSNYILATKKISILENEKMPFSLPLSAQKLERMINKLEATGHTTFVE